MQENNDVPMTSVRPKKKTKANSFEERLIEEIQSPPYSAGAAYSHMICTQSLNNEGIKSCIPNSFTDQGDRNRTKKNNSRWTFAQFIWS